MADPPIPPPPKNKSGKLSDGTYIIVSVEHKTVIDQVLEDLKYVQGYTPINNQKNQQWEITAFGAGYVIRSKFDGAYLTVDSAIADNVAIVTSPYPVTWDLQAQDEENLIFQIRWPNSKFAYDLDKNTPQTRICLKTHSGRPQLWQFKNTAAKGDHGTDKTSTDTSGDLVDSQGAKLSVGSKYKIRFADGTELGPGHLGLGCTMGGITLVSPRKSNSGAVFQFLLETGVTDKTWKSGKVGFIGGTYSELDGRSVTKYISLSTPWNKEVLAFWTYEDAQKERGRSYGFVAKQMPNRRIALYARDQKWDECGLTVVGDTIIKDRSNLGVALDCTFVKIA